MLNKMSNNEKSPSISLLSVSSENKNISKKRKVIVLGGPGVGK